MAKTNTYYIGIDVGGTKMLLQTFDRKKNLVAEERMPTISKKGEKEFLKGLGSLIEKYFHNKIKGIGIALPGIVDQEKGKLISAPHLPVKNTAIQKKLEKQFNCPILLENDVNAFLFAQMQTDKFNKYKNVLAIMLGTGVGGAAFVDGKLLKGKTGFAGEMGHMIINYKGKLKTFEQNCAGSYIPKIAKELELKEKMTAYDLAKDDSNSRKIKKTLIKNLGIGLINLSLIFEPEAIILGGSIYKRYLKEGKKELQESIKKHMLSGKSPAIFNLLEKHTAAKGVVKMMK